MSKSDTPETDPAEVTSENIPLRDLEVSPFNPRRRYDPEGIEELASSIKNDGLIQHLVVRPGANGTYEVVAGSRRLKALQQLHGAESEHPVKCEVHELDDETTKRLTLIENMKREDLTYVEEARGLAQLVTVEYREDEHGEPISETYDEYINAVKDDQHAIHAPSHHVSSVEELATDVDLTGSIIANRLPLLVLPEGVQQSLENGEILERTAFAISKLRHIPDPEFRDAAMHRLSETHAGGATGDERRELQRLVDRIIEDYEDLGKRADERTEEYAELVDERAATLTDTIQQVCTWYNDHDAFGTLSPNFPDHDPDERVDTASAIAAAAGEVIDELDRAASEIEREHGSELDDERKQVRQDMQHLERNVQTMHSEDRDRCPFCLQAVDIEDLRDQLAEFRGRIEELEAEQRRLTELRDELRAKRRDVSDHQSDVTTAISRYETELERESPDPMTLLPDDGGR